LWQAGSRGMVYAGPGSLETFTVESVTTSGLVLTGALLGTWLAGATVVPLHFAYLPESQAASAPVGEVLQLDVTFDVRPGLTPVLAEPADGTAWTDVFPTGTAATDPRNHLLGLEHNWTDGVSLTVNFPNEMHDPGLGLLSKRPAGTVPSTSWPVRLTAENDAAVARIRQFAAAHRGRAVGFFALSPVLDVESASMVAGVVDLPLMRFHPSPATTFVGLSYVSAGARVSEAATFSSTGAVATSGDTLTMSRPRLVSPARLAADAIEITHHSLGVAEVVLPLVTTLDQRLVEVAVYALPGGTHTTTASGIELGNVGWAISAFDVKRTIDFGADHEVVAPWLTTATVPASSLSPGWLTYAEAAAKTYAVRATTLSGTISSGGTDVWHDVTELPQWWVNQGGSVGEVNTGTIRLEIKETDGTGAVIGDVLATGDYTMIAIRS